MGEEGGRPPQGAEALRWLGLSILALASCGYRVGGLIEHKKVGLSIFDSLPERRTHEFALTEAVLREMAAAGIAVNSPGAEVEIVGRILDFGEPAVIERGKDEVLVSSVSIRLEISLVRKSDGKTLWTDARTEAADFATQRFESRETARREAFYRLARWVVTRLEKDW